MNNNILEYLIFTSYVALAVLMLYAAFRWPVFTLLASPLVSLAAIAAAVLIEYDFCILVSILMFPGVFLVLGIFKADPKKPNWPHLAARWTLLIGTGFIFIPILAWLVIEYFINSRQERAGYIVSTIGSSMRQNLPLAPALAAAAGDRHERRDRIMGNIADWLSTGCSLSESLEHGFPQCPGNILAMIRVAEEVDQLPLALKCIENDLVQSADKSRQINPVQPIYPLVILCITISVLYGIMYFVVPKFEKIFGEFGVVLPKATQILLTNFEVFAYGFLALITFISIAIPFGVYVRLRPRRPGRAYMASRMGDYIKWHLPFFRWFENNFSMLQVVQSLRLGLKAGTTVNSAIEKTTELDVNHCFRIRLAQWHQMVERGEDVSESARKCGLGGSLAWAFDQKANQGNTPTILETLESVYRSNYSYRANLFRYISWPFCVLAVASFVGFVVYALFSPLVKIINTLASDVFT